MTIPSTYQTTVTSGGPTRVGGNAIGVTQTANNPLTVAMSLKDQVPNGIRRKVEVKASTGGAYEVGTALAAGSLGYNQPSNRWIAYLITSHINGTANSTIKSPAGDSGQNRKIVKAAQNQFGAKTLTAWSETAWQPLGVTAQRSNWDSTAASVTAGRLSTLSGTTFKSTTNASNPASDRAVGDITVPGRLVYHTGSPNATVDTYPVFTGP